MKSTYTLIHTLSTKEKQEFLRFQQKKNRRNDTKNKDLFKRIAKGEKENLDIKIYGKASKNKFHALCKRLQDSLVDFIASKSFSEEASDEMFILKRLLAARILFEHRKYKIAFRILGQAEKFAKTLDAYALLTEIYHTKIQFAHHSTTIDLQELHADCQKNLKHFQQEQLLNIAYSKVKNQLRDTNTTPTAALFSEVLATLNITIDENLTYKMVFQMMQLTLTTAKLQRDYHSSLTLMKKLYDVVQEKEDFAHKHLFYHIQVLYLMGLVHFRNKNFVQATTFINTMEEAMLLNKATYYQRFIEKHNLLKSMTHIYEGNLEDGVAVLKEYEGTSLNIELALVMGLFQQKKYKEAYEVIKTFKHSDLWYEKKMGFLWVLKKSIIEILVLIELDKLELVLLGLQRFQKRFSKKLKAMGEKRVLVFMSLVNQYYEWPDRVTSNVFSETVEDAFDWIGKEKEDLFVMSFYAWLKSKMEKRNLYEVTLELAKK